VKVGFFNAGTSQYRYDSGYHFDQDLSLIDKHSYNFVEPAITLRADWKYVKFHAQFLWTLQMNNQPINYRRNAVSLGVQVNLGPRFKTKEKGLMD